MTKQITIYELLKLIVKSDINQYVFFDSKYKRWYLCKNAPIIENETWSLPKGDFLGALNLSSIFNIAPFDGDWEDSLIKVVDHQKATKKVVNHKKKKIVHKQGKGTSKEVFEYILDTFPIEASGFLSQEQVINDFEKWKARNR